LQRPGADHRQQGPDRDLARYVDGIKIWLRGHFDYSLMSGRYLRGGAGD
jgi:hypothetical protein